MNQILLFILILLAVVSLGLWIYKSRDKENEGFHQNDRFLLRTDEDSYDDFYSETYDRIMRPAERSKQFVDVVLDTVQPDPMYSVFLDVGSGTGSLVSELKSRGYRAYGIDQSQAMVDVAAEKYPDVEIKCDSVANPMAFDRALFTHIFCTHFTIYEIENKPRFFSNCYFWLQNNGYLILHLVEKDRFNAVVPVALPENYSPEVFDQRVLKTCVDFGDFDYSAEYVPLKENRMIFKESFKDKETQHIRQNERTLYMDSPSDILEVARTAGFVAKGAFTLEAAPCIDRWQQLVILERLS